MSSSVEHSTRLVATRGGRVRQALRIGAVAIWTAGYYLLWGTGSLLLLPLPGARRRWRLLSFRRWAAGTCRLLGMDRTVRGTPPADAPYILVTNHLSYLDVILLASVVPGVFVAKREVRSWPIWGLFANSMRTIFVDRDRRRDSLRATGMIEDILGEGENVILFPEGTSTDGSHVRPLKPALLEVAARGGHPVHYARLSYHTPSDAPPAALSVCWWGDMEFGPHFFELCRLPHFSATIAFGGEPIVDHDRKSLARKLHRALEHELRAPVREESSWQGA